MKVNRVLLLVLVVVILVGCGKTVTSDEIIYNAEEDLVIVKNKKNKPFTGTIEHYDEEGLFLFEVKVEKGKVIDTKPDLMLDQLYSEEYENEIKFRVFIKDMKIPFSGTVLMTKEEIWYSEKDINEISEEDKTELNKSIGFKTSYKNGYLHGKLIGYHLNGKIEVLANFENGFEHGESILYYLNGNMHSKLNYSEGKLQGEQIYYYESGKVKLKNNYKDNKLIGKSIIYLENGEIDTRNEIEYNHYNHAGYLESTTHYQNGVKEGEYLEYNKRGKLTTKSNYKNGKLDGECIFFTPYFPVIHYYRDGELVDTDID